MTDAGAAPEPGLEVTIADDPPTVLYAERLRDGRVALGTRRANRHGDWEPGEMQLLEPGACLALAAWLAPLVEEAWLGPVRERAEQPLRTARELYGEGPAAARRLAAEMLAEIPDALVRRALLLLANAIGPEAHDRLVHRLNRTTSPSTESQLRRRLADENEAFAYAVAAAALHDALDEGREMRDDTESG